MRSIPNTTLTVHPLCLGGNVFGWTADEQQSLAVLDRYAQDGGNFIDSADMYSAWAQGNEGGESERVLGRWMASRGNRDDVVIATKVGKLPRLGGTSAATVHRAVDESLRRLQTDHIDLYYAHMDDQDTPLEETLGAFDALVHEGKVRYVAASNFSAHRLRESLEVCQREGLTRYVALQPEYNLMERDYEHGLRELCVEEDIGCFPYYGLARGFLTGKYRPGAEVDSGRGGQGASYLDGRGEAVLRALDELAEAHDTTVAAVSLAWLAAQDTVIAPIASARTVAQLEDLLPLAELELSAEELQRLTAATGV